MPFNFLRGTLGKQRCCVDIFQGLIIVILVVTNARKPAIARRRPTAGHCIDTSRINKLLSKRTRIL